MCGYKPGIPEVVAERAAGWDESVAEYLERAQLFLSYQHPDSTYAFIADGENRKVELCIHDIANQLAFVVLLMLYSS